MYVLSKNAKIYLKHVKKFMLYFSLKDFCLKPVVCFIFSCVFCLWVAGSINNLKVAPLPPPPPSPIAVVCLILQNFRLFDFTKLVN